MYSKGELEALTAVIANHPRILVISDEIYEYINFEGDHVSIAQIEGMQDRTIVVNGMSKGFAMTGWRLGYMAAPEPIAKACAKIQGQFTSGANSFGQKAAAFALSADKNPTYAMREAFRARRDFMIELLREIPGFKVNQPQGAFYIFPDISDLFGKTFSGQTIHNADDFAEFLLQKAHVAVVSGTAFGAPNCFRLSYASSEEELREAVRRMKEVLQ